MRTKQRPPPLKRRRTSTALWSHFEWFLPLLDAPFFTHSEFLSVVTRDMGLSALVSAGGTRLQWARVRAAMCNAFPGGFAKPRRLSPAFLHAEAAELAMYRADARHVLRGRPLAPAVDAVSGAALPHHWWGRYRCPPPLMPPRGTPVLVRLPAAAGACAAPRVVPAVFFGLDGEAGNRVWLRDQEQELVVSDLDVMLPVLPAAGAARDSVLDVSPSSLVMPDRSSPGSARLGFSPSTVPDPPPTFDLARFADVPASLLQIYQSPRAPMLVSPQRSISVKALTGTRVECEVDVQQVADSIRLLDRKQELVVELKGLNDSVSASNASVTGVDDATCQRYDAIMRELDRIGAELRVLIATDNRSQPTGGTSSSQPGFVVPDVPNMDVTPEKIGFPLLNKSGLITPSPRNEALRRTPPIGGSAPVQGPLPTLRPEHMAKNVDFRNATGAALLAKALTRAALAKLSSDSQLKAAPTAVRADVMECVSACVAVLVRARATRDYHCIEEVIDSIRVRFPENSEALEAIHAAARTFDTSSSESS